MGRKKLFQYFLVGTLSHKSLFRKMASKNFNLSQVSHCHTNRYAVSPKEKNALIIINCHIVTQIAMQRDSQQKLLQTFSGVTLSHKLQIDMR
jgi:hypothetical protein